MGKLLILSSSQINAGTIIAASRGSGAANLLTHDPKEVWADSAVGSAATIDIDLGSIQTLNCVALCAVYDAVAGTSWTITGGTAGYAETTLKPAGGLRAIDAAAAAANPTHGLWLTASGNYRYIRISLTQPAGQPVLKIGRVLIGAGLQMTYGQEWGAGRGVTDTGTATRLPSGGLAMVEGARFASYAWSFGDLTEAEVEKLYGLQKDLGETLPLLVVEDPDGTAGQANRMHYGRLVSLRRFERRSVGRTRWEFTVEDWI